MYSHLLVPIDGSEVSMKAVHGAVAFAKEVGARLTFLHARSVLPVSMVGTGTMLDAVTLEHLSTVARDNAERILAEAQAVADSAGVPATTEGVVNDLPHEAILQAATQHGCDLIFMASHGRRGLSGLLLGSQTQRVLVHSPLPVLVVR
jgi:nucleotide-binding universal stress UspA family protein